MYSPYFFNAFREIHQIIIKALEQRLDVNTRKLTILTNKSNSSSKVISRIFQPTWVLFCKDLELDPVNSKTEEMIRLSDSRHPAILRVLGENYKLSLICLKLNFVDTTNRTKDTVLKVPTVTLLTDQMNSASATM